jgi:hypothetical protein
MISRVKAVAILSLLMIPGIGVSAQNPKPTPQHANPKFGEGDFLINSLTFESFAGKIGVANSNGVVKSLNGKAGDLILQGSSNITITTIGNTLTVSTPTALSEVAHDATLTGNGTTLSPLSVVSAESQREPFWARFGLTLTGLDTEWQLAAVPEGKRLVIEHSSGWCRVDPGDNLRHVIVGFLTPGGTIGQGQKQYLVPSLNSAIGLDRTYSWSQSVRFYADSGTTVTQRVGRNLNTSGSFCEGALSGYLVDIP